MSMPHHDFTLWEVVCKAALPKTREQLKGAWRAGGKTNRQREVPVRACAGKHFPFKIYGLLDFTSR